jgi:modification methylase
LGRLADGAVASKRNALESLKKDKKGRKHMVLDIRETSAQRMLPLGAITERLPVRRLNVAGIQRLKESMQQSGFLEQFPLLALDLGHDTFQLLDGNHRLEVALELGLESVPCVVKVGLTEQERYTLALRSNRATETMVPSTLVTYVEFIQARTEHYTQQQIAEMLGWSRDKVAKYIALNDLGAEAWEVIVTTFEKAVLLPAEHAVTADVTGVTFTENLLRSILGLTHAQQYELVLALVHPEKEQRITKGKFQELAKAYQARNEMYALALQQLGDLGEVWTTRLQEEVYSGAYDADWKTAARPKLQKMIAALRDEWECKHCMHLIHGDFFTEVAALGDGCIDLILTDPPYNIARENEFVLEGRANRSQDFGVWDKHEQDAFSAVFEVWAREWARLLREQGSGYVFTSDRSISCLRDALERAGLHVKATLAWCKTNPPPQVVKTNFISSTEYLLFFTKGVGGHTFHWLGDNEMHNSVLIPICGGHERLVDAKGKILHPTQKPESLLRHFVEISSNRGDTVFDGFAGTGTCGKVAREMGRKFIGIEQEQAYFDAMQRRLAE